MKIATLKRRAEFLRVRGGGRWSGPAFVLEARARTEPALTEGARFGFTVTRKVGNAVVRNRIRRRLKAVVQQLAADVSPSHDYVVIARAAAHDRAFADLKQDMARALSRVIQVRAKGSETRA